MKRLFGLLGLTLLVLPVACGRSAPPVPGEQASLEIQQGGFRRFEARCSYGRVPTADRQLLTEALQERFPPSPDNTYDVLSIHYAEPRRGRRYAFRAVLRVYGIAGPSILLLDQVTGTFDRRTREASGLERTTFDREACPDIPVPTS